MCLLAHIDKAAARHGSGGNSYSGTVAWHNSTRSRLALVNDELRHEKSNHGRMRDQPIKLAWSASGIPIPATFTRNEQTTLEREAADDAAVMACLRAAIAANSTVPAAHQGQFTAWHALAVLAEFPEAMKDGPTGKARFRESLMRLRRAGLVTEREYRTCHRNVRACLVPSDTP